MTWIVYLLVIWPFFGFIAAFELKCIWAGMDLYGLKFDLVTNSHIICHISDTWMTCQQHVDAMSATCEYHINDTSAPRGWHVSTSSFATSAATSSLQVRWLVNPWRSPSSQILGFGLGSMGFTPIYDDLRTSWITLIYDENVSSSRRLICDAQYMTFWKFVIDIILWRNFDDPWRKSTVMDRQMFCSAWNSFYYN
jgi:hypothetical protein